MRIAFSGTGNSGKTTLLRSFLYSWNNYTTPERTYREVLEEQNLPHSSKLTTETQTSILNFMVDQVQSTNKDDHIAYDRCPLDALAYSMWGHDKGVEGFTKEFVTKQINLMKESMRSLDIIFLCRFDPNQVVKMTAFVIQIKTLLLRLIIFFILSLDNIQNTRKQIFSFRKATHLV